MKNSTSLFIPWRTEGTSMHVNLLIMCKLVFLLLLVNDFYYSLNDPFIPFIKEFDELNRFPDAFKIFQRATFLLSGILLIFNFKVRLMSIILGVTIILALLASKPLFRNHIFIGGCMFLLSGLTNKKHDPWLLYMQLSIIYFGAVINKVFQIDWWSGQFMYNWLVNARQNEMFIMVSNNLPNLWFAKLLSWSSMAMELSIALLMFFRKKHVIALWVIIIFHTVLYSFTSFRFGYFFEGIILFLLIFVNWPKGDVKAYFNEGFSWLKKILQLFNLNNQIKWKPIELKNEYWLEVNIEGDTLNNYKALRYIILYSPGFYFFLFFLDTGVRFIFDGIILHSIFMVLYWSVALFFLPMILKKYRK